MAGGTGVAAPGLSGVVAVFTNRNPRQQQVGRRRTFSSVGMTGCAGEFLMRRMIERGFREPVSGYFRGRYNGQPGTFRLPHRVAVLTGHGPQLFLVGFGS